MMYLPPSWSTYRVLLVGSDRHAAKDLLPFPGGQIVLQVEHSLLPVGAGGVWGWGGRERGRKEGTQGGRDRREGGREKRKLRTEEGGIEGSKEGGREGSKEERRRERTKQV